VAQRPNPVDEPAPKGATRGVSFDDALAVEQVLAGRTEVYGDLVRKHADSVFNACWRICGNLEDARDLTQEAFLRAFENLGRFRQQSSFRTWIFRVAMNLALSQRRRRRTRPTVSLDQPTDAAGTQAERLAQRVADERTPDPEATVSEAELHGQVLKALQGLDEEHRAVVVLRDIEGFDYEQIAAVLEVPTGTVKSRLHRARLALREVLAPHLVREPEQ